MNKTEQSLARIFAICDEVAETGKPLLTESEGWHSARSWLGIPFVPVLPPLRRKSQKVTFSI